MRGVTGGLDYEEVCICGCHRCDRGLSGCSSGQEEKGGAGAGARCVDEQQREQLEVRQGLPADLPAELVDPGLSVGQERAVVSIGVARPSARARRSAAALAEEAGSGWPFSQRSSPLIALSTMLVLRTGIVFFFARVMAGELNSGSSSA